MPFHDHNSGINKAQVIHVSFSSFKTILMFFQSVYFRIFEGTGGLGLPDFKLYFVACYLVWMKEWLLLRNIKVIKLEDRGLRFGWLLTVQ